ncbi:aquaporin [Sinosporangium siamense]|uniref:aquaporin n=1 Tax=Sinosporangium siamense TaxID=1367973 RepID=UPI0023B2FAF8
MLMVMAYAGGHVSGAHYNPAATLAELLRRRIGVGGAVVYWVAQVADFVGGAAAFLALNPGDRAPQEKPAAREHSRPESTPA